MQRAASEKRADFFSLNSFSHCSPTKRIPGGGREVETETEFAGACLFEYFLTYIFNIWYCG